MKRNILQAALLLCLTLTATAHAARPKKAAADSVALIRQQADAGDAAAQNRLGTWYYNGRDVEQNYAEAVAWWTKSADKRNADAIGNLAMCYQLGHGVKADSLTAIALYKAAINEGNANVIPQHERIARTSGSAFSHRLLSECYSEGTGVKRNETTAFTHLEALACLGDVDAQFSVACRYFNTHRYAGAVPLFRAVAKREQRPAAFYFLGYMLYNGMGVGQDKADGLSLVRLAADKGNRPACYLTGYAYAHGDGVEKDGAKAREYLSKVAATNAKAAQTLAEVCLADSVPDFLSAARWAAEAKTPGREWVEKFVSENPEAPFTAYLKGLKAYYADKDYAAALKLFKVADKQGDSTARPCRHSSMSTKPTPSIRIRKPLTFCAAPPTAATPSPPTTSPSSFRAAAARSNPTPPKPSPGSSVPPTPDSPKPCAHWPTAVSTVTAWPRTSPAPHASTSPPKPKTGSRPPQPPTSPPATDDASVPSPMPTTPRPASPRSMR